MLLSDTKHSVLSLLLNDESTAESLSDQMGLNPSVIRRHLDDLKAAGFVDSRFERRGAGRPRKMYAITTEGRDILDAKYDVFMGLFVESLVNEMGIGEAKRILRRAAEDFATSLGVPQTLDSSVDTLNKLGFHCELRQKRESLSFVSKNCPIMKMSKKYPELMCDVFHTTFLGKLRSASQVNLLHSISRGAKECIHEVETKNKK